MFKSLISELISSFKGTKKDDTLTSKEVNEVQKNLDKIKDIDDVAGCIRPSKLAEEYKKRPILILSSRGTKHESEKQGSYLILEGNQGIVFFNRKERSIRRRIWVYGKRFKNI